MSQSQLVTITGPNIDDPSSVRVELAPSNRAADTMTDGPLPGSIAPRTPNQTYAELAHFVKERQASIRALDSKRGFLGIETSV